MATFNNTATLTFNDRTIQSNTVTGEITPVLGITKTAVGDRYAHGDTVTYAVSVTNSGDTAYTAATLTDNLGAYAFGTRELVPLTYVPALSGCTRTAFCRPLRSSPVKIRLSSMELPSPRAEMSSSSMRHGSTSTRRSD